MLRAVDIASHQAGISIAGLDCDIVIIKVTGGVSYVNGYPTQDEDYWRIWADEALAAGKLLAFYHYAHEEGRHGTAREEAEFFLSHVRDYKGKFVPILDFEAEAQQLPVSWPREWLEIVEAETGATPMFYAYASHLNSRDYSELARWPLWMASYLYRYEGAGWVDDPQNNWPTSSWNEMAMYQYTESGRIDGYGGGLDLSVFYGNESDWKRLEGGRMSSIETMVQRAVDIANDDYHGYSWGDRWIRDRDCSSLMYDAADYAGYPVGTGPDKTRYTGTMIPNFTSAGFTCYDYGTVELERGDILLRDPYGLGGHTEMFIGDGRNVGAHIAETGDVYGEPGDQTGYEISITPNYGNWEYVLRPSELEDDMPSAREIAEAIWSYEYKGHTMAERLYLANYADYRTDDASDREPPVEATDHERLCYMAKKQAYEVKTVDNIEGMVEAIAKAIAPKEAEKAVKGDE